MKSRIEQKFSDLRREGKKAIIPFITAGDPSLAETEKLILTLEKAGADIIELGVPFSDPMADGPTIQLASERALKKGVTLQKILDLVKRVRSKTQIPILLMGYYNPIFVMGEEQFVKKAADAGVDAVLIVDLPPEESDSLRHFLKEKGLHQIFLLAPTSGEARIQKAARSGSGFLYYVSITGVTGASLMVSQEIENQLELIRQYSRLPVVVGFGITGPAQVKEVIRFADGAVIGSALVSLIHKNASQKKNLHLRVSQFVNSLKKASL